MSKEFSELNRRLEELKKWHLEAVAAFEVFETLSESTAPNILGETEAHRNLDGINRYAGFFSTVKHACNYTMLMSLAKLFIGHKDALYIEKLVNFSEQNQKQLTAEDFKDFHDGRELLEELVITYQGMDKDALKDIHDGLTKSADPITRLKRLRDETLAHISLKPVEEATLTYQEIADLIELSEKILNTVSTKHFQSSSYYKLYEEQIEMATKGIVQLARAENEHHVEIGQLIDWDSTHET